MPVSQYELLSATGPRDGVQLARIINEMRRGRLDVAGDVTVATGAAETVITDARFGAQTVIAALVPVDAASAGIVWWLKSRAKGAITLGHDSAFVDRFYRWLALG